MKFTNDIEKYEIGGFCDASRFQFQLFPVDVTMAKVSQTSGVKAVERGEYKSNNTAESRGSIYFGGCCYSEDGEQGKTSEFSSWNQSGRVNGRSYLSQQATNKSVMSLETAETASLCNDIAGKSSPAWNCCEVWR